MNKFDVDWRPTLHLGHNKTDVNALEAAQKRATRTAARRKKIDEAIQSEPENNTVGDLNPNPKEVQTDTVVSHLNTAVQTEDNSFFSETKFLSDEVKVILSLKTVVITKSSSSFMTFYYQRCELSCETLQICLVVHTPRHKIKAVSTN